LCDRPARWCTITRCAVPGRGARGGGGRRSAAPAPPRIVPPRRQAVTYQVTGHRSTGRRGAGPGGEPEDRRRPGRRGRCPRSIAAAAACGAALLAIVGCGSSDGRPDVPTRVPATPVAGPGTPGPPAGTVTLPTPGVRQVAAASGGDGPLLA